MPQAQAAYVAQVKYAWQQQADAVLSQANPVSGTYYPVLAATDDVRVIGVSEYVIWATTQPTPITIRVTVDGVVFIFSFTNPVSNTRYYASSDSGYAPAAGALSNNPAVTDFPRAFLLEGHSVTVEASVTWAVTQPTPLVCRLRWAQLLPT